MHYNFVMNGFINGVTETKIIVKTVILLTLEKKTLLTQISR